LFRKLALEATPLALSFLLGACPGQVLRGQELGFMAGGLRATDPHVNTYSWQLFYRHRLRQRVGLSFAWTNEGHLPNHHRDGCSLQGWYCLAGWERDFSLALGVGPYRYYDTIPLPGGEHINHHGVGLITTLQGVHSKPGHPWSWLVQLNDIRIRGETNTTSLMLGFSHRFDRRHSHAKEGVRSGPVPRNVLGVFIGRTILNSLKSEASEAWILEYRRSVSPHWSLAFAYANEGDPVLMRRDGLSLQAWIGGNPGSGKLYLGVGAGPHLGRISLHEDSGESPDSFNRIGMRVSMGAGWRFNDDWMLRAAWHRTYSGYDRDTDMFVTGVGYLW